MWWYNIIGDNKVIISKTLRIDNIIAGYILLTANLVVLKRGKYEPILTVKITEWSKFIDSFGQIIEADPSSMGKKNIYI